jgi:putative membrane protein
MLIVVVAIAIVIAVIFGLVLSFSSRGGYGYSGGYGMMGRYGGAGGISILFIMVPIVIIVLIAIGYFVYRGFNWNGGCCESPQTNTFGQAENSMEILRRRYAKGEITKDQFEQMKRDLTI